MLGDPRGEASAGRRQPRGELRFERGDLLAELEEAEVEQSLALAYVGAELGVLYRRPALGAGHVGRLGERAEHNDQ
jgi:hypothetical protein